MLPPSASARASASATARHKLLLHMRTHSTQRAPKIPDTARSPKPKAKAKGSVPNTQKPSARAPTPTPAPAPRATTIPLPTAPRAAPSLHIAPPVSFAKPAPRDAARQRRPAYQRRLIEPTADAQLPAKYKATARRITAIMVGIPFVIVLGWELYCRWRGTKVRKDWREVKAAK